MARPFSAVKGAALLLAAAVAALPRKIRLAVGLHDCVEKLSAPATLAPATLLMMLRAAVMVGAGAVLLVGRERVVDSSQAGDDC